MICLCSKYVSETHCQENNQRKQSLCKYSLNDFSTETSVRKRSTKIKQLPHPQHILLICKKMFMVVSSVSVIPLNPG